MKWVSSAAKKAWATRRRGSGRPHKRHKFSAGSESEARKDADFLSDVLHKRISKSDPNFIYKCKVWKYEGRKAFDKNLNVKASIVRKLPKSVLRLRS